MPCPPSPSSPVYHSGSRRPTDLQTFSSPPSAGAASDSIGLFYSPSPEPPSAPKSKGESDAAPATSSNGSADVAESHEEDRAKTGLAKTWLRSVIVKPGANESYKDALVQQHSKGKGILGGRQDRPHGEWQKVREKYWWRKERRIRSVWQRLGRRAIHDRRESPSADLKVLFRQKAEGRCYRCLARDHKVTQCRDPPRCLGCHRFGHRVRQRRSDASTAKATDKSSLHNKLPPSTSTIRLSSTASTAVAPSPIDPPHRAQSHSSQQPSTSEPPQLQRLGKNPQAPPLPNSSPTMDHLDLLPGAPHKRPDRVVACAELSIDLTAEDRDLSRRALLAVHVDSHVQISCQQVALAVAAKFGLNLPKIWR